MGDLSTAQRILDIAQDLCQSRGFNAFSYKDIADVLGIKTASIHYHYPTKTDLGKALLTRYRGAFASELARIRAGSSDPKRQLKQFTAVMEEIRSSKKLCLCGMLASDFETLPAEMKTQVKGFLNDAEQWIEECLIAGKKDGTFEFSAPAHTVAHVFLASLQGMLMCGRALGNTDDFQGGREFLFAML